jgi:hypothetical protein
MICSQCGNDVAAGSAACPSCGAQQPANVGQAAAGGKAPPAGGFSPTAGAGRTPAAGPAGQAFNFDAKRWTRDDQIVGGASLLLLISLFLPWYTVSVAPVTILGKQVAGGGSASASGTTGHGYLWIVFILALAVVALVIIKAGFEALPFNLPMGLTQLLLVLTGINLVLVLIAFLLKPSTGLSGLSVGWGFGAFVGLICAIAAVVPLALPLVRARSTAG